MSETTRRLTREYPRTIRLDNNGSATLRLMTAADADRILAFARTLPEVDLLFLRSDITDPKIVAQWMQNLAAGRTISVLAEADGDLAGYASLHYNQVSWQRHLGEIRIQVGARYRSRGLGRALAGEIFLIARELGLRKVVAQMTTDQTGAIATFERLGFKPEALLQDFVIDRWPHPRPGCHVVRRGGTHRAPRLIRAGMRRARVFPDPTSADAYEEMPGGRPPSPGGVAAAARRPGPSSHRTTVLTKPAGSSSCGTWPVRSNTSKVQSGRSRASAWEAARGTSRSPVPWTSKVGSV